MKREGRAGSGDRVDLRGIAEFFFDIGGGGELNEFAEAGAGIGESPGRELDFEFVQRIPYDFDRLIVIAKSPMRFNDGRLAACGQCRA